MWLKEVLNRIKCKMFICCNSKCSLNDTNNDGIPDELVISDNRLEELVNELK